MKQISKATKTGEETLPEHYVLLCARRYASTVKKFALAVTDDERQQHRKSLRYILDSGLIEAKLERERRLRRYPHDFRKALVEKDGSIISRAVTSEEAEILRYAPRGDTGYSGCTDAERSMKYSASHDLHIGDVRRPRDMAIWKLEPALKCRSCRSPGTRLLCA